MKKFSKIYLPLLCLVLLLVAILGLSSCGDSCDHEWEQGVTVPAGCNHQGAIAYTCTKCGEIKTELIPEIGHSFTNYVDDGNATCQIEGTKTAVCDNGCGATHTQSVPKRHVYALEWTQTTEGHFHVCTVCGENDGVIAHTPDADGMYCTVCEFLIHEHVPTAVATKNATCTEIGLIAHWHCELCNKRFADADCKTEITEYQIPALGHSAAHVDAKAATCTAPGNVEYWYCDTCDKYFSDAECESVLADADRIIAVLDHTYTDRWFSNAEGHWHQCECGAVDETSKAAHTPSGDATDVDDKICTVCYYIIEPATGHTHSVVKVTAKPATCTENGNLESWYCEGCNRHFVDEACSQQLVDSVRVLPALGHDSVHFEAKAPTCLENGYQEHWYCNTCEKHFSDKNLNYEIDFNTIVRKARHTAVMWVQGVAATCTKNGNITHWHCETCDKYYSDEALTVEITAADATVAATGHTFTYIAYKAATCNVKGNKEYWVCSTCNKLYKDGLGTTATTILEVTIDAVGHQVGDTPSSVVEPTCLAGGYSVYKCIFDGCGYNVQGDFKPIGPCSEVKVDSLTVPATCQEFGKETYECEHCHTQRVVNTPKSGHDYEESVVAPTCTEAGYTKHTCKTEGCGYYFKDSEVSATGHDLSTVTVDATCTTPGSKTTTCGNGECTYNTVETIDALGHDVNPTCEEESECARGNCDYTAPALGHVYRTIELKDPTCTEHGYEKTKCDGCGKELIHYPEERKATGCAAAENAVWTEVEKRVGETCTYYVERSAPCAKCGETIVTKGDEYTQHKEVASIKTTATCSSVGYKTYTCSVCNEVTRDDVEYSDPEAHSWGTGVLQSDGVTTLYTCVCGQTKTSVSAKNQTAATVDSETIKNSDDVELENATFVPDSSIKDNLSGDVELSAEAKDKSEFDELSQDVLDRIGDQPIYNLEMSVDGESKSDLGGTMTVRIPYDLDGEDPENIMIWYIEGETVTEIKAVYVVIDGQGYAEFSTSHFSYYTVTKMKPAERCKLYGHNVIDMDIPATCLTDGYTMHVCTRCGLTTSDNKIGALGHEFVLDDSAEYQERTCVLDGTATYECERCQVSYTVVDPAVGHNWVVDTENSVEATCANAGSNVYNCECGETKTEGVAPLKHAFRENKVAPTCTEPGYTTRVCRVCDHSDVADIVPALGHDMKTTVVAPNCVEDGYTEHYCARCNENFGISDIVPHTDDHVYALEAATCTEDRLCTACGHRESKATGHKFDVDGVCANDGCSEKCTHDYEFLKDVEATCAKRAHKLMQCKVCFGTKETEYTGETLAHNFDINGICTECKISSGNHFLSMLYTWKNTNGFSLKIDDFSLSVAEYVEENSAWYVFVESAQLSIAELMIYTDAEGALAGAFTGSLSVVTKTFGEEINIYSVKGAIENGNVYIELTNTVGDKGAKDVQYVTVSIDYIIASLLEEAIGVDKSEAEPEIEWISENILPLVEGFADKNASQINAIVESLVNLVFTEEATEDGYVYILDYDKIYAINYDLQSLPIAEFINKYFGDEAFNSVFDAIDVVLNTKVPEIPALLDSLGISSEAVAALINDVAEKNGQKDFDILAIVNSDDYKDLTVADLMGEDSEETLKQIESIKQMLTEASVFDLVSGALPAEMVEIIKQSIPEAIEFISSFLDVQFETNAARTITAIKISVKDFEMEMEGQKIDLSVDIELVPGGRINVNFESIINEINQLVNFPEFGTVSELDGIHFYGENKEYPEAITFGGKEYTVDSSAMFEVAKKVINYSKPSATLIYASCGDDYISDVVYTGFRYYIDLVAYACSEGMLVGPEGSDELALITGDEENRNLYTVTYSDGTTKTVDLSKTDMGNSGMMEIDYYIFYLACKDEWFTSSTTIYMTSDDLAIRYDSKTGEYELTSYSDDLHEYVLDESKSVINTECETTSYLHYVCENCGHEKGEYERNNHEYAHSYKLIDGAISCTDGVVMYEYCPVCDKVLNVSDYVEYYHSGSSETYYDEESNTLIYRYECVCGEDSEIREQYTVNSELELEYGNYSSSHNSIHEVFKFVPAVSGTYEVWTANEQAYFTLYNSDFTTYGYKPSIGGGMAETMKSGNMAYELVAGETYYLRASIYMMYDGITPVININLRNSVEYSLADYGCTCGAKMTVTDNFGTKTVEFSECQDGCALSYETVVTTGKDDDCRSYEIMTVTFTLAGGETKTFEVYKAYTGSYEHSYSHRDSYNTTEIIGANGNVVIVSTQTNENYCRDCGRIMWRDVYKYYVDKKTRNELGRETEYYYDRNGELMLERSEKEEYSLVTYQNGTVVRELTLAECFEYRNGKAVSGYSDSYVYNPLNRCEITVTRTSHSGKVTSYKQSNHQETTKLIQEECGTATMTDSEGRRLTVETYAEETYCATCFASISKRVQKLYSSEDGTYYMTEEIEYVQYATDDVDYGYVPAYKRAVEYGVYTDKEGNEYDYQLSWTDYEYENGELNYWQKVEYLRDPANLCTVTARVTGTYYPEDGTDRERYTSHIAQYEDYELNDPNGTCLDGIAVYSACAVCGYRESRGMDKPGHHPTEYGEHVTHNLTNQGCACGTTVEVYYCLCGQNKNVAIKAECDFRTKSENYVENETGYYWEYVYACAVTDPPCGFEYTEVHGVRRGPNCERIEYTTYTFGDVKIESSYYNGYEHNFRTDSTSLGQTTEDGYTVSTTVDTEVCVNCNHNARVSTYKTYYIEDVAQKGTEETVRYNDNGSVYWDYYREYTYWYSNTSYTTATTYSKSTYYYEWATEISENTYVYNGCAYDYTCHYSNRYIYEYGENSNEGTSYGSHQSWNLYVKSYDKYPTCSQFGSAVYGCLYCSYEETGEVNPYGHNFYYDGELGCEVCNRCGLQNMFGNDGSITMEDLTAALGNGENYVIGYWNRNKYEGKEEDFGYSVFLSLVVEGIDEPIYINYNAIDDGVSLIYINARELASVIAEMAEAAGVEYSLCKDMLRVSIVPLNSDGMFDYSITLDPHMLVYSSSYDGEKYPSETTHSAVCLLCEETVIENESCNFTSVYESKENGYAYKYTCRDCGFSYYEYRYEEVDGCNGVNYFDVYVLVGGEYVLYSHNQNGTFERHSYVYENLGLNEEGYPIHSSRCTACGTDNGTNTCWGSMWLGEEYYDRDGVQVRREHWRCACGFEFYIEYYTVENGCTGTNYEVYSYGKTYTNSYENHNSAYENLGLNEDGYPTHRSYCTNCGTDYGTSTCWGNEYLGEEYYENEYGQVRRENWRCVCGFEFYIDRYSVDDVCSYIDYEVYSYGKINKNVWRNDHSFGMTEIEAGVYGYSACANCGKDVENALRMYSDLGSEFAPEYSGSNGFNTVLIKITVETSGNYVASSELGENTTHIDTCIGIYNEAMEYLAYDDDSGNDNHFYLEIYLEAGTYYLEVGVCGDYIVEGSFRFNVTAAAEEV